MSELIDALAETLVMYCQPFDAIDRARWRELLALLEAKHDRCEQAAEAVGTGQDRMEVSYTLHTIQSDVSRYAEDLRFDTRIRELTRYDCFGTWREMATRCVERARVDINRRGLLEELRSAASRRAWEPQEGGPPRLRELPVIWSHGGKGYSIGDRIPVRVTHDEDCILTVFAKEQTALSTPDLAWKSGVQNVAAVLSRLRENYGECFAAAIHTPNGRKGSGGYFIRVKVMPAE